MTAFKVLLISSLLILTMFFAGLSETDNYRTKFDLAYAQLDDSASVESVANIGYRTEKPGPFLNWPLPSSIGLTNITRLPDSPWTHNFLGITDCPPYPALIDSGYWPYSFAGNYNGNRQFIKPGIPDSRVKWLNFDNGNAFTNAIACYGATPSFGLPDHAGTDITASNGTNVLAAAAANEIYVVKDSAGDYRIRLKHSNVNGSGQTWYTFYVHLSKSSFPLGTTASNIAAGTKIGEVGNGHLHFQTAVGGNYANSEARNLWGVDQSPWNSCLWVNQNLCATANPVSLPPNQNLIVNGTFSDGVNHWTPYGDLQWALYSNVLHFKRLTGGSGGAAYQDMAYAVPPGTPFEIRLDLGNTSNVTKRPHIFLRPSDNWSDTISCQFTIAPKTSLDTYIIRGKTGNTTWSSMRLEVWPDPPDGIPDVQMDNVSIKYIPGLSVGADECIPPDPPDPPNQPPSPPTLSNPANGATIETQYMQLSWQAGNDDGLPQATPKFLWQISRNATFTDLLVAPTMPSTEEYQIIDTPSNGTYYWRVRQSDGELLSSWSSARSFTVAKSTVCNDCGPGSGAWPVYRGNNAHTGRTNIIGPDSPMIAWQFHPVDANKVGTPVIDINGIIYAGVGSSLYAFNQDGSIRWKTRLDENVNAPILAANQVIYATTEAGTIFAVSKQGSVHWSYEIGSWISAAPTVDANGVIYVGASDAYLYALNPDGTLKWRYGIGSWMNSSPAIADDGTIYIGSTTSRIYALSPDGQLKWDYATGNFIDGAPAIGNDGTIYIGSIDGFLYALRTNGTLRWRVDTGGGIGMAPAIGHNGTIYVGNHSNLLLAISPTGQVLWQFQAEGTMVEPLVDGQGTIYVGSYDGRLYALNPNGSLKWQKIIGGWLYAGPVMNAQGTLYVGNHGTLFAISNSDSIYLPMVIKQ